MIKPQASAENDSGHFRSPMQFMFIFLVVFANAYGHRSFHLSADNTTYNVTHN